MARSKPSLPDSDLEDAAGDAVARKATAPIQMDTELVEWINELARDESKRKGRKVSARHIVEPLIHKIIGERYLMLKRKQQQMTPAELKTLEGRLNQPS